ncbi:MAG TPA: hypothetical protein VHO06_04230 [Polyangia bacterium]|nr:hypothetical protein [Polyangia bacterium]
MRSAAVVSVLAALASPAGVMGVARAAPDPAVASARLEVQAAADCTTREELVARVAARSRRIRFDDGAAGPTLRAVIAAGPRGGAVGELVIAEPDGRTSSRRISAPSCAEATDAVALVIALTLDPTSAAATRPTASPGGPTVAAPAAPGTSAAPPGVAAEPSASRQTATSPDREPARAPARKGAPEADEAAAVVAAPPAAPVAERARFGAGVTGQALVGAAPDTLAGLGVYLVAALDRDALWSPAAVLWGTHAAASGLVEPGGTAAFTLDALTLDACALRLRVSAFEARACASALYGRLGATGSDTYAPASVSRPYLAAGGAVLLTADLGHLFELSGRVSGGASLIRDSFSFSPAVFHRTAAATLAAGLGFGLRFP